MTVSIWPHWASNPNRNFDELGRGLLLDVRSCTRSAFLHQLRFFAKVVSRAALRSTRWPSNPDGDWSESSRAYVNDPITCFIVRCFRGPLRKCGVGIPGLFGWCLINTIHRLNNSYLWRSNSFPAKGFREISGVIHLDQDMAEDWDLLCWREISSSPRDSVVWVTHLSGSRCGEFSLKRRATCWTSTIRKGIRGITGSSTFHQSYSRINPPTQCSS
jgi:hypothetical protein